MTNKRRDCNLTKRIVELDGLRGIAVLLILYYHYAPSLLCRLDQAHPGGVAGVKIYMVFTSTNLECSGSFFCSFRLSHSWNTYRYERFKILF